VLREEKLKRYTDSPLGSIKSYTKKERNESLKEMNLNQIVFIILIYKSENEIEESKDSGLRNN